MRYFKLTPFDFLAAQDGTNNISFARVWGQAATFGAEVGYVSDDNESIIAGVPDQILEELGVADTDDRIKLAVVFKDIVGGECFIHTPLPRTFVPPLRAPEFTAR